MNTILFSRQSKGLCFAVTISMLSGYVMADNGLHTLEQGWKSTSKNTCSAVHNINKGDLKDEARAHCEQVHGSKGLNKLRDENYTKTSCDKTKSGRQVVEVIARGALTFNCKA